MSIKYILFTIISSISLGINAMEITNEITKIPKKAVFASHKLGDIELYHGQDGFMVHKDGEYRKVKSCFVDKPLRNIKKKQLDVLSKIGYIKVGKYDDGEYSLKANVRGPGGGPALANFAFWMTRSIGYGVPLALGTGALVATLPVVTGTGVAAGGATALSTTVKGLGGYAIKTAVVAKTTTGAIGANVVANSVIATVGTKVATDAVVTTAAATSMSGTGYVAFVEGLAAAAYVWCLTLPTF